MLNAIDKRTSRRTYEAKPIEQDKVDRLKELIGEYNNKGNLEMKFLVDARTAFDSLKKSYGVLTGVRSVIMLSGDKADPHLKEKCGYYGERLVLDATNMGLGTCWVGGTYDEEDDSFSVSEDRKMVGVITIGHVKKKPNFKEKLLRSLSNRKGKTIKDRYSSDREVPDWFIEGIEAVHKAPTALNSQKPFFKYEDGDVRGIIKDENYYYDMVDLGIAKLHFELATGKEFQWGNGAGLKDKSS